MSAPKNLPRAAAAEAAPAVAAHPRYSICSRALKVPGTVLYDLDGLSQHHCDAIELLADLALRRLALDVDALVAVRALLLAIQDHAVRLEDGINTEAESHGCNFASDADAEFRERLRGGRCGGLAEPEVPR